jgi:hypothetical protein
MCQVGIGSKLDKKGGEANERTTKAECSVDIS